MDDKGRKFDNDLMLKLKDPEFASAYIAAARLDNDLEFLDIALGDVAKAQELSKRTEIKNGSDFDPKK